MLAALLLRGTFNRPSLAGPPKALSGRAWHSGLRLSLRYWRPRAVGSGRGWPGVRRTADGTTSHEMWTEYTVTAGPSPDTSKRRCDVS